MSDINEKPVDANEDLVEIEVDVEAETEGKADSAQAQAEAEPATLAAGPGDKPDEDDEDDEDDEEDERLSAEQREDESKLTRNQRAKLRRREARERQKMALEQAEMRIARAELNSHRTQVELAAYRAQQDSAKIDQQAASLQNEYRRLQQMKANALSKNDGAAAVQADHRLMEVQQKYAELGQAKARVSEGLQGIGDRLREIEAIEQQIAQGVAPRQPPMEAEAPAVPRLNADGQKFATDFMESLPWYRPGTKAGDSAIVDTIDVVLIRDGFDPNSKEYWTEFRARLKAALPEKFRQLKNPGPPVGAGREALSANKTTMRLPRDAITAMKQWGIIDENDKVQDRKKFDSYVARFKQGVKADSRRSA
jgi:hypothetical protein